MASNSGSKRMFKLVTASVVLALAIAAYYFIMLRSEVPSEAFENGSQPGVAAKLSDDMEKALETNGEGLSQATVILQTTRGKIKYKFYTKDAPKTVHRIASLIQGGFYNGLIFHRVVPGFVIQGGDPTGTGRGGSGTNLPAEFNSRKHVPGTVAMARAQDPNSADSQFYIALGTLPALDGNYTVFGQVVEGQEIANQIQPGDRMTGITIEK